MPLLHALNILDPLCCRTLENFSEWQIIKWVKKSLNILKEELYNVVPFMQKCLVKAPESSVCTKYLLEILQELAKLTFVIILKGR